MVGIFQLAWVPGRAGAFQVARRGVDAEAQVADAAGHQRLVGDVAAAHHAVDVLVDQVDPAIAHAHVELDIGVACVEGR